MLQQQQRSIFDWITCCRYALSYGFDAWRGEQYATQYNRTHRHIIVDWRIPINTRALPFAGRWKGLQSSSTTHPRHTNEIKKDMKKRFFREDLSHVIIEVASVCRLPVFACAFVLVSHWFTWYSRLIVCENYKNGMRIGSRSKSKSRFRNSVCLHTHTFIYTQRPTRNTEYPNKRFSTVIIHQITNTVHFHIDANFALRPDYKPAQAIRATVHFVPIGRWIRKKNGRNWALARALAHTASVGMFVARRTSNASRSNAFCRNSKSASMGEGNGWRQSRTKNNCFLFLVHFFFVLPILAFWCAARVRLHADTRANAHTNIIADIFSARKKLFSLYHKEEWILPPPISLLSCMVFGMRRDVFIFYYIVFSLNHRKCPFDCVCVCETFSLDEQHRIVFPRCEDKRCLVLRAVKLTKLRTAEIDGVGKHHISQTIFASFRWVFFCASNNSYA